MQQLCDHEYEIHYRVFRSPTKKCRKCNLEVPIPRSIKNILSYASIGILGYFIPERLIHVSPPSPINKLIEWLLIHLCFWSFVCVFLNYIYYVTLIMHFRKTGKIGFTNAEP